MNLKKSICLALYYCLARFLPKTGKCFNIGGRSRFWLCRRIFKKCGNHVNIERGAHFESGINIEIGDYSGIGINARIPSNTVIGNYVMMGPNCLVLAYNHNFDRLDIPMRLQGLSKKQQTVIGDDVWIGANVVILPGRTIQNGCVIGAGCVLTKDFPMNSVIGGNPSRLLKSRA